MVDFSDKAGDTAEAPARSADGGIASVRAMGATLAAMWQTRLDLLLTELEEERQRLLGTLLWGALTLALGSFTLLGLATLVVVLFWDSHRVWALVGVSTVLLSAAFAAAWQCRRYLRRGDRFLAATLAELEADRQRWFPQEPT